MARLLSFLVLVIFFISCQKEKQKKPAFYGVWVESSLRLDTLDFEYGNLIDNAGNNSWADFRTNKYVDSVLNPTGELVFHNSIYEYYFEQGRGAIAMRSMFSSSSNFPIYNFSLSADKLKFTIDKFYQRRSVPVSIEFVRIR